MFNLILRLFWSHLRKILDFNSSSNLAGIVGSLLDEGAQLGVSSRGMGSLKEKDGMNVVQDDF